MIGDKATHGVNTAAERKPDKSNPPTTDRIYRIACTFPALSFKGMQRGNIPGIGPDGFCAGELHDFLYNGGGGLWSSGEVLILQFLLNLYDPYEYKAFNFGRALDILDPGHMSACLKAAMQYYNGE
jgi:hypothetical protein